MTGREGRQLRKGYTTGACAAAAAKAATLALVGQAPVCEVEIALPAGCPAVFKIENLVFNKREASCSVIKDAGDDPDVTNGAEIRATVSYSDVPGIVLKGGEGVGTVTRPGLEVPIGSPAINPVPRHMIMEAVLEASRDRGIQVVISVPRGRELARKTLNSRLGIIRGISILGTTGIVIPFSVDAYTACISQALDVAAASGCPDVVLTTGRRSEKFAQREIKLPEQCFVQAGDFIGFSLAESAQKGLAGVTIWGMPGKISKMAAGHMATNVRDSHLAMGFLMKVAANVGISPQIIDSLTGTRTANQFFSQIPAGYVSALAAELCRLAAIECRRSVAGRLEVECIMADYEGNIMGRASNG